AIDSDSTKPSSSITGTGHWDSSRETPVFASPVRGVGNPCGRRSIPTHRASTRCARREIVRSRIDVASFILLSVVIINTLCYALDERETLFCNHRLPPLCRGWHCQLALSSPGQQTDIQLKS